MADILAAGPWAGEPRAAKHQEAKHREDRLRQGHSQAMPTLPVALPRMPPAEAILPYLREIDASRIYSNHGPLARRLAARLANRLDIAAGGVATVVNATLGITLALQAVGASQGSLCLMPAWTFAATAHAAVQAGLVPYFLDVDRTSWAMEPAMVRQVLMRLPPGRMGAVLPVCPYGRPLDLAAWDAFEEETGIPVVVDAAAGFDALRSVGRAPVVVSMHATKGFGAGEGGFVASRREDVIRGVTRRANFGFLMDRSAQVPATNAKLSEYHAAVGLASFDAWPDTRAELAAAAASLTEALSGLPGLRPMDGWGTEWVGTTNVVEVEPTLAHLLGADPAGTIAVGLDRYGVDSRRWWGEGLHREVAFADFPRDPLPVTDALARTTLGLPFRIDPAPGDVSRIAQALQATLSDALDAGGPAAHAPAGDESTATRVSHCQLSPRVALEGTCSTRFPAAAPAGAGPHP